VQENNAKYYLNNADMNFEFIRIDRKNIINKEVLNVRTKKMKIIFTNVS